MSFFMLYYAVLSHFSCVQLFVTLWTVAFQAPLSMGFSRQEYWNGLPFPTPNDELWIFTKMSWPKYLSGQHIGLYTTGQLYSMAGIL